MSSQPVSQPSIEEFTMIRDYTLLPHMLTMIQRNLDEMRLSYRGVLKDFYLAAGEDVANRISWEMNDLRRELNRRKIKVSDGEQDDFIINHHYRCRGYEGEFGITKEETRAQISIRFGQYVSDLMRRMKPIEDQQQ